MDTLCDSMDTLCDSMDNFTIKDYNNTNLINDLNIIINEIVIQETFDLDIYDICVSCGHDLVWNNEYFINEKDIKWLKNEGYVYFFTNINSRKHINTTLDYFYLQKIYKQLFDIFSNNYT